MGIKENEWNLYRNLLIKKFDLEKKDQELDEMDHLQLVCFGARIHCNLMYRKRHLFIELFSDFVNNPGEEEAENFSDQFQGLYEYVGNQSRDLQKESLGIDDKVRLTELKELFKPNNKNILEFSKVLTDMYGDCDFYSPILSQEDTMYLNRDQLENSVKIALNKAKKL